MSYGHAGKVLEYLASRRLPDGRRTTVKPAGDGRALLAIYGAGETVADRLYRFTDMGQATLAMMAWDGEGEPPGDWQDADLF